MRLVRLAGPLLLLLLAGCGVRPVDPAGQPADQLRGHTFLSSEITVDGRPHDLVAGTRVSLDFADDGRLVATAGCNTMSGPVRTGGGTLDVDGLASTELGCDPARHAQDTWLADLLGARPTWRLDGPVLTIRTADTTLVLTDREVAEPDRSLAETTWAVDTIIEGQAASSTPAGAPATLVFRDERVEIFAGCNSGSTGYTTTGDTIRFDRPNMTLKACRPDIMRLEAAVLGVIQGEVMFEIDADHMTLTHPSGRGLQLRAQ